MTENNVDELNPKRQQCTWAKPATIIKRRILNIGYLTYRSYDEHVNLLGEDVFDQSIIASLGDL